MCGKKIFHFLHRTKFQVGKNESTLGEGWFRKIKAKKKKPKNAKLLWRFSELLFYPRTVRWQDRTHAVVVSHVTSVLLPEGWHANTYCSAHSRGKSEAAVMLILSDGSICGIVASNQSVTNRLGWLLAIQLLLRTLVLWADQHVYSTNNIDVFHGTK